MRRLRLVLLLSAGACSADVPRPSALTAPTTPTAPTPIDGRRSIRIGGDVAGLVPGARLRLQIMATDADRLPVNTDEAQVSVSDPAVATVVGVGSIAVSYPHLGRSTRELTPELVIIGPGQARVHVMLDGSTAEIELQVRPVADGLPALAVDSFTVIEYRASCAFDCPYLVYAPLLTLREITGRSTARVVGVEFTIPGFTTGVCRGLVEFPSGVSANVNGVDPYLWNNDLIFVEMAGTPVPDGPATARVWVQSDGVTRVLNAVGAIRRSTGKSPDLPPLISNWSC